MTSRRSIKENDAESLRRSTPHLCRHLFDMCPCPERTLPAGNRRSIRNTHRVAGKNDLNSRYRSGEGFIVGHQRRTLHAFDDRHRIGFSATCHAFERLYRRLPEHCQFIDRLSLIPGWVEVADDVKPPLLIGDVAVNIGDRLPPQEPPTTCRSSILSNQRLIWLIVRSIRTRRSFHHRSCSPSRQPSRRFSWEAERGRGH